MDINVKPDVIMFKRKSRMIKFKYTSARDLSDIMQLLDRNFVKETYAMLSVKSKIVIDIGANIGDTAIYFAISGAKHVYAFEPYPYIFHRAKENVKINKLGNKITLVNMGCGGKSSRVRIKKDYRSRLGEMLKDARRGEKIKVTTLKEILSKYNLHDVILKMDCEGCEYGILLNTDNETLRKFRTMFIKYHYGYVELAKKLKAAGFSVNVIQPLPIKDADVTSNKLSRGSLFANRSSLYSEPHASKTV